jgi:hypothetical protein
MPQSFVHDPDAILDYTIDWAAWLDGDTLSTSLWAVAAGTATLDDEAISGDLAQVWVSDTVTGEVLTITNSVLTVGGRADDRTLTLLIQER